MPRFNNDLFGKNYPTRPGFYADGCTHDPSKTIPILKEYEISNKFEPMRRPGFVPQPRRKFVYDFDQLMADNILKFGTKVHIDDAQFSHTFRNEEGKLETKNLTQLSFDVSSKLSELRKITESATNAPLNEKMEILNDLIAEIAGKFALLSKMDMNNISKIVSAMGDKITSYKDLGLSRYLTSEGFKFSLLDPENRLTLFLSKMLTERKYIGKKYNDVLVTDNNELARFMSENPNSLYDMLTLDMVKNISWVDVAKRLTKNGFNGLIDDDEYDDHPNNSAEEQKKQDTIIRKNQDKEKKTTILNKELDKLRKNKSDIETKLKTKPVLKKSGLPSEPDQLKMNNLNEKLSDINIEIQKKEGERINLM
jgi:hypothetical protein